MLEKGRFFIALLIALVPATAFAQLAGSSGIAGVRLSAVIQDLQAGNVPLRLQGTPMSHWRDRHRVAA